MWLPTLVEYFLSQEDDRSSAEVQRLNNWCRFPSTVIKVFDGKDSLRNLGSVLKGFPSWKCGCFKRFNTEYGYQEAYSSPGRWVIRTKVKTSNYTWVAVKWHHWKEHRLVAADILLYIRALPAIVNNHLCFYICESLHLLFNFSAFAFTPLPVGSLVLRCPLPFRPLFPFLPY